MFHLDPFKQLNYVNCFFQYSETPNQSCRWWHVWKGRKSFSHHLSMSFPFCIDLKICLYTMICSTSVLLVMPAMDRSGPIANCSVISKCIIWIFSFLCFFFVGLYTVQDSYISALLGEKCSGFHHVVVKLCTWTPLKWWLGPSFTKGKIKQREKLMG